MLKYLILYFVKNFRKYMYDFNFPIVSFPFIDKTGKTYCGFVL